MLLEQGFLPLLIPNIGTLVLKPLNRVRLLSAIHS